MEVRQSCSGINNNTRTCFPHRHEYDSQHWRFVSVNLSAVDVCRVVAYFFAGVIVSNLLAFMGLQNYPQEHTDQSMYRNTDLRIAHQCLQCPQDMLEGAVRHDTGKRASFESTAWSHVSACFVEHSFSFEVAAVTPLVTRLHYWP